MRSRAKNSKITTDTILMDEIIDLIAKIEMKAKLIQQYAYEKEAMEKKLLRIWKR